MSLCSIIGTGVLSSNSSFKIHDFVIICKNADELRMAVKEIICENDEERRQYEEALVAITVDQPLKRYGHQYKIKVRLGLFSTISYMFLLSKFESAYCDCRYCQQIDRSDFWGGESELLVSTSLMQALNLLLLRKSSWITTILLLIFVQPLWLLYNCSILIVIFHDRKILCLFKLSI